MESDLKDLTDRLSQNAQVYVPGDAGFETATTRWSVLNVPTINIVVVPSVEDDVAETVRSFGASVIPTSRGANTKPQVKYANEKDIPYLAVSGGHGGTTTVGRMQNGIEIWLKNLSSVQIAADGKTAQIGGGALTKTVIDTLWPAGKQTVTGNCECTSILGPGLGGGHGALQGRHGLVADQFISMNIVLADGTLQTIDEESSPDLWWAMRGAGHNFGIVTSVTSKIYDVEHPDWAYQSFFFTGGQVEGLYRTINDYQLKNGTQPVDVINYGFFFNDPDNDPTAPLVAFYILQEGVTVVDPFYTTPFLSLGPAATGADGGKYSDLAIWTAMSEGDPPCQKAGLVNMRFPIDLKIYNPEAMRKVYDLFRTATQETPTLNNSLFLYEGYSLQGVQGVPRESSAFANRDDALLLAPLIVYPPEGPELERTAAELGEHLRQILHEGSGRPELHTYVNYAFGDESLRNMYGYEQWRQDRLLSLKNMYDPERRFSFYAPIA